VPARHRLGRYADYDAVVVGARVAGAATAMLLGRAGWRVLLVDRAPIGGDTVSTHALLRGGVLQLHRWGLLDAVRASGTPALRHARFHYGDETVALDIRAGDGVDALFAPRRTVLDPLLVRAARDAGVDVVTGVTVEGLVRDRDRRVVGLRAHDADGGRATAYGDTIIGADGASSRVARLVGARASFVDPTASALVYGYWAGLPADGYDWYFRPGAAAGVVPTNDGLANVFVGLPPARLAAARRTVDLAAIHAAVLRDVAPQLARTLETRRREQRLHLYAGRAAHLRTAHGPGWALVGDAGCFADPVTAHGMTDAMRDAELLARSLVTTGSAASYEATRDLLVRPMLELSSAIASFDWDLAELRSLHRGFKAATEDEAALLRDLPPISSAMKGTPR
jgi:flavin-dependent dehydrogenase